MKNSLYIVLAAIVALPLFAAPASPGLAQTKSKTHCSVREGVEFYRARNYGKALTCWEESAARGSSAAQYNIARMYALGEGVPRNAMEAYKWMTIASRGGRPEAQKALESIRKNMTPEQISEAERRIQKFYTSGRR